MGHENRTLQVLVYKGKVRPRISYEGPEGKYRYKSTLSLTLALVGVGG